MDKESMSPFLANRTSVSFSCSSLIPSSYTPKHGAPLQILDMGRTSIDENTFDDYITELREHYTADKVS